MKSVIPIVFFSLLFSACVPKGNTDLRPNIILISADDMGWSDLGCYGSEVHTPNIDRLASEGMRFTRFHNTSKCFPSRACLITGVYAQDCGYDDTFRNPISHAVTIGEVLQKAGYLTYWSGKHHGQENPYFRGFDHYFGLKDGACNYFNPGHQREGEAKPAQKRPDRHWCIDSLSYIPYTPEKGFYTTDYFTNYALTYIKEASEKNNPFFLYLAYNAPHDPLMAWPEDILKYRGKYDSGYQKIREARYHKQLETGLIDEKYKLSEPSYDDWESLTVEEKAFEIEKMEVYAAMIDRLDQNVGRVLDELKKSGMLDNTVIFFVSDNGASAEVVNLNYDNDSSGVGSMDRWVSLGGNWANVGNTPYRFYKNYSYEGGINTPLIAWWPEKIKPNSITEFAGHFIDIMPTLIDISGSVYPDEFNDEVITPMRGVSLLPVLEGGDIARQLPLYWEWRKGQAMYFNEWKIVRYGRDEAWDLYHLSVDPSETNNLCDAWPEKVAEMDSMYGQWKAGYEK